MKSPHCTVLIPSCNRQSTLLELLRALQAQDYPHFDILVVEQTPSPSPAEQQELEALEANDARIQIVRFAPLGVGGARNKGMELATGEIVLIIDDDDLPASDRWISQHLRNYQDPHCIAVSGADRHADGRTSTFVTRFPKIAHRMAMSYTPFGTPIVYATVSIRKVGAKYLRGGNASIRREWALQAGGWIDECGNGHEEHDFSFRLRKRMGPSDYMVFDPTALMIRRLDIEGGAERRSSALEREIEGHVRFYFRVIARHQPLRVLCLLPFYPWVIYWRGLNWYIDDRAQDALGEKALGIAKLTVTYPYHFVRSLSRLRREVSATNVVAREHEVAASAD